MSHRALKLAVRFRHRIGRAAAFAASAILCGCSNGGDAQVSPIVRHALEAYRDADVQTLSADVARLETMGFEAAPLSSTNRTALDAAARLRALKALLWHAPPFSEQLRLSYAQHLCSRKSWADTVAAQADDQRDIDWEFLTTEALGCEGATSTLTLWQARVMLWNIVGYAYRSGDVESQLLRYGFVQPSPHRIAGFSFWQDAALSPLTPGRTAAQ